MSEWWFWEASAFMAGRLGTIPLAAHSVAYNVVPMCFMIPLGFSFGCTTRVGTLLGNGQPSVAQEVTKWALGTHAFDPWHTSLTHHSFFLMGQFRLSGVVFGTTLNYGGVANVTMLECCSMRKGAFPAHCRSVTCRALRVLFHSNVVQLSAWCEK